MMKEKLNSESNLESNHISGKAVLELGLYPILGTFRFRASEQKNEGKNHAYTALRPDI